jgi:ribosome-associated protein
MTDDEIDGGAPARPSKGQLKRETEALRELAKRLLALPPARLAKLPLADELREAVLEGQGFERGALARQLRYLTGLLREADTAGIAAGLERLDQPQRAGARAFRQIEQWRDALAAGDDALLAELLARYPAADAGHLRQLVRDARAERARDGQSRPGSKSGSKSGSKPGSKSGRQLFRFLAGLLEGS